MKEEGGSVPAQVRVYQGKESDNFLEIFNSRNPIIIKQVHKPVIFYIIQANIKLPAMYHIQLKGSKPEHTCAIQLDSVSSSRLCSNSTFTIETDQEVYIWYGQGSVNEERDFAFRIADKTDSMLCDILNIFFRKNNYC